MAIRKDLSAGDVVSAAWARGLSEEVLRLGRVRGGGGVSVRSSAAGILILGDTARRGPIVMARVVERLGPALDANGRGLGAGVWYRVSVHGRKDRAEVEVPPARILRSLETASPARLTPFAVGAYVPLMIVPRRRVNGDLADAEVWMIAGERYFSAACG
jgi:hypothetical protein